MSSRRTDGSAPAPSSATPPPEVAAELVTKIARVPLTAQRLATLLTTVGGSVRDDDHLVAVLQRAVDIAHEAIDGATSCGVTIATGGRTYTAVHTDSTTLEVDDQQYRSGEGPCLEAAATGTIVRVDIDAAEQRWPEFAKAAEQQGIHSFLAASLHAGETKLGSFNLYGADRSAFDDVDESVLEVLTTTVSQAIGDYARVRSAEQLAEGLREAMAHRAPIEQAKGMLMALHSVDADAAFAMLSTQSQRENRKLRDVARDFVYNVSSGGDIKPAGNTESDDDGDPSRSTVA